MEIDGSITNERNIISSHIIEYYKGLFGVKGTRLVNIMSGLWQDKKVLTVDESQYLERDLTEDEIKQG